MAQTWRQHTAGQTQRGEIREAFLEELVPEVRLQRRSRSEQQTMPHRRKREQGAAEFESSDGREVRCGGC